jgi:hypothetical protein
MTLPNIASIDTFDLPHAHSYYYYIPAEVLTGTKAEAVANKARRTKICFIMVVAILQKRRFGNKKLLRDDSVRDGSTDRTLLRRDLPGTHVFNKSLFRIWNVAFGRFATLATGEVPARLVVHPLVTLPPTYCCCCSCRPSFYTF